MTELKDGLDPLKDRENLTTKCVLGGYVTPGQEHQGTSRSRGRVGAGLGLCPAGHCIPQGSLSLSHHPVLEKLALRLHICSLAPSSIRRKPHSFSHMPRITQAEPGKK